MKLRYPFLLLVCLLGCTPKPAPGSGSPRPAPETAPAQVPAAVPAPAVPTRGAAPQAVAAPVPARAFDESILRGREFLLEAGASRTPALRDPAVGILGTDREQVLAARQFFRSAAEGPPDPAVLVPRWAAYLRSWAARARADGLKAGEVRLGTALPETDGETLVPVRVRGEGKDWSGWLALVREGGAWLVSDVQLVGTVPRDGPFDPESSGQEISSPSLR